MGKAIVVSVKRDPKEDREWNVTCSKHGYVGSADSPGGAQTIQTHHVEQKHTTGTKVK